MDLAFQIMNMISVALAIVLTMMKIRARFEPRGENEYSKLAMLANRSNREGHGPRTASIMALIIGFSDLLFVMYGPPRDVPLTGETGALLAYGLFFIFMGFYLRQR